MDKHCVFKRLRACLGRMYLKYGLLSLFLTTLLASCMQLPQQDNADVDPEINTTATSQLPKMPVTTEVIVLDISRDLRAQNWQAKEAYMVSAVIQGLVNRSSTKKIYFINSPQEHRWTPYPADKKQLEDGLIPVTHTYPTLDTSKTYPVLSYLLRTYRTYIKGKILVPELSANVIDGAVMAGITASGVLDAIPVTPAIDSYIRAEGYAFTQRASTRGLTSNIAAYRWAKQNYFRSSTTRAFIGQHSYTAFGGQAANQYPMFYDYFVANRAFVFSLNANDPNQRAEMANLLNTGNYPVGTPILGLPVDEGQGLVQIESLGYYVIITNTPNSTVTSSFPSEPSLIRAAKPPTAAPLQNNSAYVAFYVTDGDSLGFATNFHYEEVRDAPLRGSVPIGWSLNPHLLDLFPTLVQWYSQRHYNDAYELVADFHDGLAPRTSAGETAFVSRYRQYLSSSNRIFNTINYFDASEVGDRIIGAINPYFGLKLYQGNVNGNDAFFKMLPNTTIAVAELSGSSGALVATAAEMEQAVRFVVNKTPVDKPAFVVVVAGPGCDCENVTQEVQGAVNRLRANPNGRNYNFLRPVDVAATWKAYQASVPVNLALGRPGEVSSALDGSTARSALDGDMGTRWTSEFSDPQWLYVDLGQTRTLRRLVLKWEAAYATAYQVQVSANLADAWTNVYNTTTGDGGTDEIPVSTSGRYVRIYGTRRAPIAAYSLYELEVYGN